MAYGKLSIGGVSYDLSHLNNILLRVRARSGGAKVFRARVQFGCHSFTKESKVNDDPEHIIMDGGTARCFCPIRYGHSLMLPDLFREAGDGGDTYFGASNNMLMLDTGHEDGPYIAAYTLRKSAKPDVDVMVQVRSAYMKPNLTNELGTLPFYSIVAATARGQKVVAPEPRVVFEKRK